MKVIDILRNILIQEFQHSLESRLIHVMSHKMLPIQFVLNVNLIQMKVMKVIRKMKNISIQEFQHFLESKLIEVMNIKMLQIQFVSSVNLVQM
jgi:retron-type reverse transcriptase